MPLDRFVLIVVSAVAAAGATVWIGAIVLNAFALSPAGWVLLMPAALVAYVVWRVISERLSNKEDDHYARIER